MTELHASMKLEVPQHFAGVEDVASLTGGSIRRFLRLLPKACRRKGPTGMVVSGPYGTGKTFGTRFALWQLAKSGDLPVDLVVGLSANGPTNREAPRPGRMSDVALCRALVSVIDGVPVTKEPFAVLESILLDLLSERRVLIVIDEGEQLEPRAMTFVQSLIDNTDAPCAFVLIGSPSLRRRMSKDASALASRLPYRVAYEPLSQRQVTQVMPLYHPRFGETSAEVLRLVNRTLDGRFRPWALFTEEANESLGVGEGVTLDTALEILADIEDAIDDVHQSDRIDEGR